MSWKLPPSSQVLGNMMRISQKTRLESLKTRLRNFTRKIQSLRARREREIILTLMIASMISTVLSVIPKVGHFGLIILRPVVPLRGSDDRNRGKLKTCLRKSYMPQQTPN